MNRREKISTHFMNKELTMTLLSTGTDYDALAAAFRPIFTRIAQGAAEREQQRILPDEPIRWLKEAGFGTHEELMEACESYREISISQMGGYAVGRTEQRA